MFFPSTLTAVLLFNSARLCLSTLSFLLTPSAERNLVTLAPYSESEMDCFIMGVFLAASLGLYGPCWTLAGKIWLTAER